MSQHTNRRPHRPVSMRSADNSDGESLGAPPDAPHTEQYQPVPHHGARQDRRQADAANAIYHARANSYASEDDGGDEDEDTLTMPVPHGTQQHRSAMRPSSNVIQVVSPRPKSPSGLNHYHNGHGSVPPSPIPPDPQHWLKSIGNSVPASRSGIVDSSGFYFSTRDAAAAVAPPLSSIEVVRAKDGVQPQLQQRRSSPQAQEQQRLPRHASPPALLVSPPPLATPQYQYQQHSTDGTSLPPQSLETPSSRTPRSPQQQRQQQDRSADVNGLALPLPSHTASSGSSQWQLASPQEHKSHRKHRGAAFDYASEAVTSLEKQYGDALQRLATMQRLYTRMETQNVALEAEVLRLRKVYDVLCGGISFRVYNTVRQLQHELRLLKQYVTLLCASHSDHLLSVQRAVAEELPRLLDRGTSYNTLIPFGAEGRLRPVETRASLSSGLHGPTEMVGQGQSRAASANAYAATSVYRPDHWWATVEANGSPRPTLSAQPLTYDDEDDGEEEEGEEANRNGFAPSGSIGNGIATSQDEDGSENMIPYAVYREVQKALATAQRRVVELEQDKSNQQADFEARITQLKVTHKERQSTMQEEVTMLRRLSQTGLVAIAAKEEAGAVETISQQTNAAGALPMDVNGLAELLRSVQKQLQQQQQQQQKQPSIAGSVQQPQADRTVAFSDTSDTSQQPPVYVEEVHGPPHHHNPSPRHRPRDDRWEDDGMVDSRESSGHSGEDAYRSTPDIDYDIHEERMDPFHSFENTNRRVVRAVAHDARRPRSSQRLHNAPTVTTATTRSSARVNKETGEEGEHSFSYDRLVTRKAVAVDGRLTRPVRPSTWKSTSSHGATEPSSSSRVRSSVEVDAELRANRLARGLWAEEMLKDRNAL